MKREPSSPGISAIDPASQQESVPGRLIYEATFDAMWIMRVEANDRFVISSINPAYTALTGLTPEAMVGKSPADFLRGDDLAHVLARHREAVEQRRPLQYEESIVVGRPIMVETTLTPVFDATGRCTHILGCTRDIGERKALELARASLQTQLREARSSNAIGSLATGIANEFSNMLEVIQSHLDIARRDARRSAKVLKSLAACSKASTHARGITKQVLAFSTDSGSERHVAELSQVVREAVDLARVTLRGAHELHYPEVEGDIPVSMNVPQMQQAIISLLLTATRSLGALGGEIGIYVDSVTLSDPGFASLGSTSGPTLARIGIEARMTETTGDGRSEGSESATFTTARRAATETEIDFSRRIIAAHEGATVLNQESDATLRVSVYLPIASSVHEEGSLRATRPSPRPADGRGASRGTGRAIMYVDDHKWLLPLVERLLADSEYEVRGFIDPRAAIDALHRRPEDYALVATDYKMAKVSGLDIARAAKAAQPDLPVVIISAYLTNDLLAQSLRAGADEVLSKSSITRELVPTVERLLRPKLEVAGSRR